jgi:prepilin-type N-terminal cleavage/methylation domain-containing protein
MIFTTGRARINPPGPRAVNSYRVRSDWSVRARAFTLLELLLVIAVLVILAGVVWPNLGAQTSAGRLAFTAHQVANLIQFGRSESMCAGKPYRFRFDPAGMRAVIEEETDPMGHPGEFEPILAHWASVDLAEGNIRCLAIHFDPWESKLKEQEEQVLEGGEGKEATSESAGPINFYPDGTSDSATLLLGDDTGRNYTLILNGLTGRIRVEQGNLLDADKQTTTK